MPDVSAQFDFFNPFLSARIITPNAEYPLWTAVPSNQPEAHDADQAGEIKALSFLNQVTVETNLGQIPQISATLTPPYKDGIALIDSALVEYGKNRLQVQFGYARGPDGQAILSDVYEGLMQVPEISFGGAEISITLKAQGVLGVFHDTAKGSGQAFKNETRLEVLKKLAKQSGLEFVFDESADALSTAAMKNTVNVSQGWRTNHLMSRIIANQANCQLVYRGNQVIALPRNKLYAATAPTFVFYMMGAPPSVQGGIALPIFSASTEGANAIWLTGISRLIMTDVDPIEKKTKTEYIDDKSVKPGQSGEGPADLKGDDTNHPPPDEAKQANMIPIPGNPADKAFVDQANSAFSNYKARGLGIQVTVETIGVPNLVPGVAAAVQGLGIRLDTSKDSNKYGVHKVTHKLGTDGFTCTVMMISNTAGWVAKKQAIFTAGSTNNEELPSADDPSGNVKTEPTRSSTEQFDFEQQQRAEKGVL